MRFNILFFVFLGLFLHFPQESQALSCASPSELFLYCENQRCGHSFFIITERSANNNCQGNPEVYSNVLIDDFVTDLLDANKAAFERDGIYYLPASYDIRDAQSGCSQSISVQNGSAAEFCKRAVDFATQNIEYYGSGTLNDFAILENEKIKEARTEKLLNIVGIFIAVIIALIPFAISTILAYSQRTNYGFFAKHYSVINRSLAVLFFVLAFYYYLAWFGAIALICFIAAMVSLIAAKITPFSSEGGKKM